ncbi:MAG TPA: FprA family A-type flavoprotein [bacterium]|nr:FprA family A-type flavoprotein [bacterium]
MNNHELLVKNVWSVGANDPGRRLFDGLIPLPDGTSYNAYLVKGSEKTALIDSVDPQYSGKLLENLHAQQVTKLDYIISNHAEQDHSGSIPAVLQRYPEAQVVTNAKNRDFLISLLHISEDRIQVIHDGERLSLGDATLRFYLTPWVHWPETMVTYLEEEKILFSCDFFGSHLAPEYLTSKDDEATLRAAKRYFAEIMMPFSPIIAKNLEKLSPLDISMIAPSHGPVFGNPAFVMNAYREWIKPSYRNKVILPYVSMHGSTEVMVNHLTKELEEQQQIPVERFDLTEADIGELAMALVDAPTLILATPTVLQGAHPAAAYAAMLVNALRPPLKHIGLIGSFGWGTRMVEQITSLLPNSKADLFDPVLIKGLPRPENLQDLTTLASSIATKHASIFTN